VPGAFSSSYTRPSTVYVGQLKGRPVDDGQLRVDCAHAPLAWMLVLTQLSVGLLAWMALHGVTLAGTVAAAVSGVVGIVLSAAHLGQPLKAWRAFLGWRKSWLSREIIIFGLFAPMLLLLVWTQSPIVLLVALGIGLVAVACSVMVYVDTRRPFWSPGLTSFKFFGTGAALGLAFHGVNFAPALFTVIDGLLVWRAWRRADSPWHHSARIMVEELPHWLCARAVLALLAIVIPFGWVLAVAGAVLERLLFFKAAASPRMPGS